MVFADGRQHAFERRTLRIGFGLGLKGDFFRHDLSIYRIAQQDTRVSVRLTRGRKYRKKILGLFDQAVMDRVKRKFEAIGNTELIENIVEVVFHRLFADEKFFADFAVAEALGHKLDDFFFALAEQRLFAALAGFRRLFERFHYFGRHAVIEPDFAIVNLANALQQQIARGLFQHHAAGAQTHRADHVAVIFGSRDNNDARLQRVEIHFFEDGEAVLFRHAQIEQQNIGLQLREHLRALNAVRSFADNLHVVRAFEQFAQAIAEDSVIVRDQNSNRL